MTEWIDIKKETIQDLPFVNLKLKDKTPRTDITIPEHIEPLTEGYCGLVQTPYGLAFADSNPEALYIATED